jgi:hypothetical protein
MKCGGSKPTTYIYGIKLISMNKKEIKNAINKAAYEYASEFLGYEIHDDGMGGSVTFMKPGTSRHDDTIDWHRSHHETCVLNWASDEVKLDAEFIDAHMKPIIEHYNSMYVAK